MLGELMRVGQDDRYGNRVGLILDDQRIDWLQDCQRLDLQITEFELSILPLIRSRSALWTMVFTVDTKSRWFKIE
jgi:hypothetical protein